MNTRIKYLDYMRIFASLGVMLLHISGQNWMAVASGGAQWQAFNVVNACTRWSVPVFLMISGALFLGREIPLRRIYGKYVLRLVTAFLFWSALYAFWGDESSQTVVKRIVSGHYHMWFILMIVGLYVCQPILRRVGQDERLCDYYLLVSFVFTFLAPQVKLLCADFAPLAVAGLANDAYIFLNNFAPNLVFGYPFYFILGYRLSKVAFERGDGMTDGNELKAARGAEAGRHVCKKAQVGLLALGGVGFALTIALTAVKTSQLGYGYTAYYDNFTLNVLMESVSVFAAFKIAFGAEGSEEKKITAAEEESYTALQVLSDWSFGATLSDWSFGAYLAHAMVLEHLDKYFGLNTLNFGPVASMALIGLIVVVLSFAISGVMHLVPVVKKYLV